MSYSYVRNARRPSKTLETPVTRGHSLAWYKIHETAERLPVEIKAVCLDGVQQNAGHIDVTFFNQYHWEFTQRVYLQNSERTGPNYQYRQLLAAIVPDILHFTAMVEESPVLYSMLEGARCLVDIDRKAGGAIEVDSKGDYVVRKYAPQQQDHGTVLSQDTTLKTHAEAVSWMLNKDIPYAWLHVSRWLPWDKYFQYNHDLIGANNGTFKT